VVRLLLDAGTVDVESKAYDGETLLSWAAKGGHAALVRQFEFHLLTSPLFTAFVLLDWITYVGLAFRCPDCGWDVSQV
jgi:hypothetical protein